jgi:hypothetical protein
MQAPASCCWSRRQAALRGHYECYSLLCPYGVKDDGYFRPFEASVFWLCLRSALRRGNVAFALRLCGDHYSVSLRYMDWCVRHDDPVALQLLVDAASPVMDRLVVASAYGNAPRCLRHILKSGLLWIPWSLYLPCKHNWLGIVDVVIEHTKDWDPDMRTRAWDLTMPITAATRGHTRLLMRMFDAGCPMWTSAADGEPLEGLPTRFHPAGHVETARIPDGTFMVSTDLARSGPVLLYAAQKGAPLTPRMQGLLGDVRRRALTVACCVSRAARLAQAPGARARRFRAMGKVPIEIISRILTMARLSIVVLDLVE